jgi:hypothetical protein
MAAEMIGRFNCEKRVRGRRFSCKLSAARDLSEAILIV